MSKTRIFILTSELHRAEELKSELNIYDQWFNQLLLYNVMSAHDRVKKYLHPFWGWVGIQLHRERKVYVHHNFIYFLFSHTLYPIIVSSHLLLQVLPPGPAFPRLTLPLFSFKKYTGFPRISIEHGITSFNKTSYQPSYQDWMR